MTASKIDDALDFMLDENAGLLLDALQGPEQWGPKRLSQIMRQCGIDVSEAAVRRWRRRNGV